MADVIYVGCKMPNGVVLDLDKYEVIDERTGTVRTIKSKIPPVRLKGNAVAFGKPDISIDGYVFTPVPLEFWTEWLKSHSDLSLLADGYIKAAPTMEAARKIAREHEAERGQFPRLVPDGDERTRGLDVETADEQKAKKIAAA